MIFQKGWRKPCPPSILGRQIDGVWHTGVVVYGKEYYFGGLGGIESCDVGGTVLGAPDTVLDMGSTEIPKEVFMNYLADLSASTYRPEKYHLLEHNCNNFSADTTQFLTGKTIPSYITGLPSEFLSTPLGQMIKPLIDQLSVQPSGGRTLFPASSGHSSKQNKNASSCYSASSPENFTSHSDLGRSDLRHSDLSEPVSQSGFRSDPVKKKCPTDVEPVIFKPDGDFLEQCMNKETNQTTDGVFPPGDTELWQEITEYLSTEECSFSLGRIHLQIIGRAINNPEISVEKKLCMCHLLQLLVLRNDFLHLLSHDTSHMVTSLLTHFMEQTLSFKIDLIKMLANCYSSDYSRAVMSKVQDSDSGEFKMEKRISQICTSCLLDETVPDMMEAAAGLVLNISLGKVSYDTELEIGSALLHCLRQPLPTEKATLCCLSSVLQFTECNAEVRSLAGILGIDWSQHTGISSRAKQICDKLLTQIN
ncbi:uncharacterized protein LOC121379087 isoform X1 [Gigantopelta aegis]|uniref:uncharacterized protein LOC121379087 isoform X1 n=1 Tax=Gigantopelta aegis TaxID=1735272 RepID=UPI001B888651|nr:uncharacterized protein LOC121379087 isoform X1 [Gigantopelta aegis]